MIYNMDFPHYEKTLTSFERNCYAARHMNLHLGWACTASLSPEETVKFDENMNHKHYDQHNIPRVIQQPVDFTI